LQTSLLCDVIGDDPMLDLDTPLALGPPPPIFIPPIGPVAGAPPPAPAASSAKLAMVTSPAPPPPPLANAASSSAPDASAMYVIQPGDTLGGIAAKHGTTVAAILKENPEIDDPNKISVGQKIDMPGSSSGSGGSGGSGGVSPPASKPKPKKEPKPKPKKEPNEEKEPTGDLVFPLWIKPRASWKDGPRYFGCPRSGGTRKHAGVDLYAPFGAKIRAIADGVIIRPPYYFYDGTNALEVFHPGVGVVRYGEISSSKRVPAKAGQKVKMGEHIAYVGLLDSLNMSMIHFELFGASARGQNLTGGGPYRRHPALKNPTKLIDKLYKLTFG
jgi:murein DD-endopeptidase MepM/ murein hydrolase activator NlpD